MLQRRIYGTNGQVQISDAEARVLGATPAEFRAALISMGCPAHILDSVERRNAATAEERARRRAQIPFEQRAAATIRKNRWANMRATHAERCEALGLNPKTTSLEDAGAQVAEIVKARRARFLAAVMD